MPSNSGSQSRRLWERIQLLCERKTRSALRIAVWSPSSTVEPGRRYLYGMIFRKRTHSQIADVDSECPSPSLLKYRSVLLMDAFSSISNRVRWTSLHKHIHAQLWRSVIAFLVFTISNFNILTKSFHFSGPTFSNLNLTGRNPPRTYYFLFIFLMTSFCLPTSRPGGSLRMVLFLWFS